MNYRTLLFAPPPWPERGGGKIPRGAQRHYNIISTRHELLETVITSEPWQHIDRTSAHVYMWTTDNYLSWALWLYEQLGAKHHRCLPWMKDRMGLGQYFRGCHELLLFGTLGKGMATCKTIPRGHPAGPARTDALAKLQRTLHNGKPRHSEKPAETYDIIEHRSHGPYVEMFARNTRDGWKSWGHEVQS
jgi:N6-adenosine-specific RNA methylase IME4